MTDRRRLPTTRRPGMKRTQHLYGKLMLWGLLILTFLEFAR